ncbi:hypothetical protein [Flavivirga jejuensis]|uniref:Uncharacterized protein n=1 Tax=Flavivirga jejuensis TaxID=870487 RepID=A0ABT8WVT3_9FLAO|nr:hypothetical protein [Flavivirga jejuensis]MDO5977006.1 hypothetical protein [Flavivirga jejuensis]
MKHIIILLFFVLTHSSTFSQSKDSLHLLIHNKWTPYLQQRWLDKDTFYLKSMLSIKSDFVKSLKEYDIVLPNEDVDILLDDEKYRNLISFDSNFNVRHDIYSRCLVGETIYHIFNFNYYKGKILICYSKAPWKEEKKNFTKYYSILRWDNDYLMFKKE